MDSRGTKFVLSRDELLTLPEFVLLSLFPNGLFPEGHMGGMSEGEAVQVDVSFTLLACRCETDMLGPVRSCIAPVHAGLFPQRSTDDPI